MGICVLLLAMLGSPKYVQREQATFIIDVYYPLSFPIIVIGLNSHDAETKERCKRSFQHGNLRLLEWLVIYLIHSDLGNQDAWIRETQLKWLESFDDGTRLHIEAIVLKHYGFVGHVCKTDSSLTLTFAVRGYLNIMRHHARGLGCGGWLFRDRFGLSNNDRCCFTPEPIPK